ncbi:unnamed protein product [Rotaria sordida]|uniref:Uncharacterized protein n=1 Tax=Rotaria sordida TaxID=392033 RepID=A0A815V6A7_9BILA|nr:unnamed protein product [Rotaria sordida]CAF1527988.1 unnamed protein product [Rotaria sordida]
MENNDSTADQRKLSTSSCTCHRPSPYNEQQLWSLQKAFLYSFNLFIDKTSTMSHWSYGLSSIGSSLTHAQRTKMINYAKYDVMAVTYLIRPITEQWSFTGTKESSIEEMFITFQSTRPPPLRQPKSKKKKKILIFKNYDEIYLNQLIESNDFRNEQNNDNNNNNNKINLLQDQTESIDIDYLSVMNDDEPLQVIDELGQDDDDQVNSVNNHSVIVDGMNNPNEHHQQRIKKKRSLQAKQKKNRKRNNKLRSLRYKYYLTRSYYYRFKPRIVKKVLRYYGVQYRHATSNSSMKHISDDGTNNIIEWTKVFIQKFKVADSTFFDIIV